MGTWRDTWEVQSRHVVLPVRIRDASLAVATFLAPAAPVRRRLAGTGLAPVVVAGRSPVSLLLADYRDSDLGVYAEVGTALLVRHGGDVGVFVTQLPVTAEFTRDAGRSTWGLPKWLASCELSITGRQAECHLADGARHVLSASLRSAPVPLPLPVGVTLVAFSVRDGQLLRTEARVRAEGVRVRPGGAALVLGREHPMAVELRELELPRTAVCTVVVRHVELSIGPPRPVSSSRRP